MRTDQQPAPSAPRGSRRRSAWLAVGPALVLSGCLGVAGGGSASDEEAAAAEARALRTQALVMGMADDYIAALAESVYLLTHGPDEDSRSRWLAQSFLRNGVGASIDIGAGSNPAVAVLDLLVLASLQAWSFEAHWMPAGIGGDGAAALARLRQAETELWDQARAVLPDEQLATLRQLVDAWIAENPDRTVVALVRLEDFADERKLASLSLRREATGLLREVGEARGAIDDARLLGERLLWSTGRFLYLVGQQAELTTYRIADQPEGRQLVEALRALGDLAAVAAERLDGLDAEREELFADLAAERARAIEQLQDALSSTVEAALTDAAARLADERDATLAQFFELLAAERATLLDDLAERRSELGDVLTDLRETVQASTELAHELKDTADAVDRVVSHFDRPPGDEREPLELRQIRDAALETRRAAQELTRALDASHRLVESEAWDRRVDGATEPLLSAIDRAFVRGLLLVAALTAGACVVTVVAVLGVRRAR